jgi:tRNA(Ile)-lysidine synthase
MRGARPQRALDAVVRSGTRLVRGLRLCVACSGGPDSVALASLLDRLAREDDAEVVLAHVNHAVRPSADQDECVTLSIGARLERRVLVARPALARSDEATLRQARYAALEQLARGAGASVVVTAHTAEDQTETILLSLFRGTGVDGLAGMAPRRALAPGIDLVRPLLRVTRAELATELRHSGLPYAIDPSNADRRYRRNALRVHLAALRGDFPALDRAVARFGEILRDELDGTPRAGARRELRAHLHALGVSRDLSFAAIEAALDAPRDR